MQIKMQNKLLLATNNPGKVVELRALLAELPGIELVTPGEIGLRLEVAETGSSYAENAGLKAAAFAKASGLVTLADDSGLEVDALDGEPGIRSARYAPQPRATDADRRAYLLANLAGHPRPWTARFRAVIAVMVPGEAARFRAVIAVMVPGEAARFRAVIAVMVPGETAGYVEGVSEGEIIPEERGSNGFGYDPIFYIPGKGRTMAELGDEEKNRISHRGRALRAGMGMLRAALGLGG